MTRSRLAPSPTGAQHLGNARTHLVAYWAARKIGDELVLRIDDLDSPRVKDWAIDQAVEDIRWLGIEFDGPATRQTCHQPQYEAALEQLMRLPGNLVYPCYCSRKDIVEALSAPHESRFRGEGIVYPGTCRDDRGREVNSDVEHCLRLTVRDCELEFNDLLLGKQVCQPARELGDFPIATKSGQVTYQLAVVVDDVCQGVDFVVRGNDLIASTFRQLEIYHHLGHSLPRYAHLPLVLGKDGRRLAKRHGDTRLSHYRELGVRPEDIVGWAAFSLGIIDRREPCAASDLIDQFDWAKLASENTVIDAERLFEH